MWILGALRGRNDCVVIHTLSLSIQSHCCVGLASLSPSLFCRFPKCPLSFLLVFTLVIPLGFPSEVPRKARNRGHGIFDTAVKFGKLMILCRKQCDLDLQPGIWVVFRIRPQLNHMQFHILCQYSQHKCLCTLFS